MIVYFPVIISPLIMGYVWYFLFQYDGGAPNDVLLWLGQEPLDWLATGSRGRADYPGQHLPVRRRGDGHLSRRAEQQSADYLEAATMDGATGWRRFRAITLPLLMPAITVSMVLNIIGGLKLFDVIIALTNGGPGTR